MRLKCTDLHAQFSVRVPTESSHMLDCGVRSEYTRSSYHRVGHGILPHRELNRYGHMLKASYQVESYKVLQSTHGVTLLLNLPVYIKVYSFGMEMSQRSHFLISNFIKMLIFFEKMAKKITFLIKTFCVCDKFLKIILSWKCWNCLKIMLRHNPRNVFFFFFFFFEQGNIFENLDQKVKHVIFDQK